MRKILIVLAGGAALGVTACGGSSPAAGTGGGSAAPVAAATSAASSAGASSQSGAASPLDPCQLVTSSEASALAGTTFGPGREEKTGGGKVCVYGYQTTNVFTVEVGQDKSASDARAQWSREESQARSLLKNKVPAGISVHVRTADVDGLADRAATVYSKNQIAGHMFGISGIYLLKGGTVVAFQDLLLGGAPPSTSALESQARTTLSRVP
jgi:Protein of unknown function (DUF3558)